MDRILMFAEKHSSLSSYAHGDSLLWTIRGGYARGYPVAYPGEGPKKNFGDRSPSPLFKVLDDRAPPLISRSRSGTATDTQYNGHNGLRTCNLICNFHCAYLECAPDLR